jgi:hypothetical protein
LRLLARRPLLRPAFVAVLSFALGVLVRGLVQDHHDRQLERENEKIKSAFRALVSREPGCLPAEEQRIICARKNGAVSILILGPKDEVVAGPLKTTPLKRRPLGRNPMPATRSGT